MCVYDSNERGYVLLCNSSGILRQCDGRAGEVSSSIELEGDIEASPAVFGDTMVIGTRTLDLRRAHHSMNSCYQKNGDAQPRQDLYGKQLGKERGDGINRGKIG